MNGRHGLNRIAREARVTIDRAVECAAKLIIHRRWRQNLDVVHDRGHSLNAFRGGLGVRLQRRPRDLAIQSYFVTFYFVSEIVEYRIPRQHHKLVAHFLGYTFWFTALLFLVPWPRGRLIWQSKNRGTKQRDNE